MRSAVSDLLRLEPVWPIEVMSGVRLQESEIVAPGEDAEEAYGRAGLAREAGRLAARRVPGRASILTSHSR